MTLNLTKPLALALAGAGVSLGAFMLRAAIVAAGCPFAGGAPVTLAWLALFVGGPLLGAAAFGLEAWTLHREPGAVGPLRGMVAVGVLALGAAAVALSLLSLTRACVTL